MKTWKKKYKIIINCENNVLVKGRRIYDIVTLISYKKNVSTEYSLENKNPVTGKYFAWFLRIIQILKKQNFFFIYEHIFKIEILFEIEKDFKAFLKEIVLKQW